MKNLQTLKKFAAIVVSAIMVLSTIAMPVFAGPANNGTTVQIKGADGGVIVELYKIVKQDNDGNWVNMYKKTVDGKQVDAIADPTKPSSAEILELAQRADLGNKITLSADTDYNDTTKVWSKDLAASEGKNFGTEDNKGPGMYLVLVKNGADNLKDQDYVKVYNPMIVSVGPDQVTGALKAGTVDASSESFESSAEGNVAYVKSSTPDFDKYIIRKADDDVVDGNKTDADKLGTNVTGTTNVGNTNTTNENKYGDTDSRGVDPKGAQKGDVVWFEIATTIPAYADNYTNPVFKIHDTLSSGLALVDGSIEVYVGGTAATNKVEEGTNTYSIDYPTTGETYVINFASSYLNGANQKSVVVRYAAKVQDNCKENFDPETNTAYITYTHKPGTDKDSTTDSEEKKTYHYTFSINGKINGEGSQDLREVVKVGSSIEGSFVFKETEKKSDDNAWVEDIQGAVFKLYKANTDAATDEKPFDNWTKANNDVIRTATSDKDGRLMGLDRLDAGDYVLIEESVPLPYAKKTEPIAVRIEAKLKDNGQLESYKITVGGVVAGNYKATYDAKNDITKIEALADDDSVLATYEGPKSHTNDQVIEKYSVVPKREGESDADYAARIAEYLSTFDDVHPEAADIRNTKTGSLPSTGGMGTVLFTVGGIAIMALAIFLLFGGKKREEQK